MNRYFISYFYGNEHPASRVIHTSYDLEDEDDLLNFIADKEEELRVDGYYNWVLFNWKKLK